MLIAEVRGLRFESAVVAGAAQLARIAQALQPTPASQWAYGNALLREVEQRVYEAERAAGLIG
jgi:hypothetical protein